ncbi:MAG: hypothetical protein ACM3JI_05600 [Anaerolineae bacterium]
MPDFDKIFSETKERPVIYKGMKLLRADKFPVANGDILIASIEATDSDHRQGLCIDITGHCEYEGKVFKHGKGIRMLFWEDTAPKEIKLKIFTKKDFVWIENIWENTNSYLVTDASGKSITKESKSVEYGHGSAAMIVEEIENGRRYRCNDGYPHENFDDIVFTVQKLAQ